VTQEMLYLQFLGDHDNCIKYVAEETGKWKLKTLFCSVTPAGPHSRDCTSRKKDTYGV